MKTALIVIDVQKYFVNEKTTDKNLRKLPGRISDYIENNDFDFIIFTVHVNKKNSNHFKILGWKECTGKPDAELHDSLKKFAKKGNLFEKSTYSAFKSKRLLDFLKRNNISKVFLCGVDTDACLLASAYDAFDLGFDIAVLKELCASHTGNNMHECAKRIMEKNLEK